MMQAVEATTHELQLMRRQLASAHAAQAAAESEAATARAAAERAQRRQVVCPRRRPALAIRR